MAGSALCMPLREPLRRPRTAATAVMWLRRASALREGLHRPVGGRQLHWGYASPAMAPRRRVVGSGERRAGRPTPIGHPTGLAQPVPATGRQAPDPGGERLVGSVPGQARCGAGGPPRALRHGPSTSGARGACTWRRPRPHRPSAAMPAGGTGRRPDMRSSARPPAVILTSWPTTWHLCPHRSCVVAVRLSPRSPSDRRRPRRFTPSARIPECGQRGPQRPWLRPCEPHVAPPIIAPSATATAALCVAFGAKHRRLAKSGPSEAVS